MSEHYILEGMIPVQEDDLIKWAQWFEGADRGVALDELDGVRVSTVFLGLDHNFSLAGPPLLFETMVFGGKYDQEQERYSTWETALQGHNRIVEMVREGK